MLFDGFKKEYDRMPCTCPQCQSERINTYNYAKRTCGAVGTVAGAVAGAAGCISAAEIGAMAGFIAGPAGAAVGGIAGAVIAGQLHFFSQLEHLNDTQAFARYLAPTAQADWVVYAKPPFGGPHQVSTTSDVPRIGWPFQITDRSASEFASAVEPAGASPPRALSRAGAS